MIAALLDGGSGSFDRRPDLSVGLASFVGPAYMAVVGHRPWCAGAPAGLAQPASMVRNRGLGTAQLLADLLVGLASVEQAEQPQVLGDRPGWATHLWFSWRRSGLCGGCCPLGGQRRARLGHPGATPVKDRRIRDGPAGALGQPRLSGACRNCGFSDWNGGALSHRAIL